MKKPGEIIAEALEASVHKVTRAQFPSGIKIRWVEDLLQDADVWLDGVEIEHVFVDVNRSTPFEVETVTVSILAEDLVAQTVVKVASEEIGDGRYSGLNLRSRSAIQDLRWETSGENFLRGKRIVARFCGLEADVVMTSPGTAPLSDDVFSVIFQSLRADWLTALDSPGQG